MCIRKKITFNGETGIGYGFEQKDPLAPWAREAGIAVFTAPDTYGWRVIRFVELTGRDHDVRPLWAFHDAERYGANAIYMVPCDDRAQRKVMLADLEAGFSPVVRDTHMDSARAA